MLSSSAVELVDELDVALMVCEPLCMHTHQSTMRGGGRSSLRPNGHRPMPLRLREAGMNVEMFSLENSEKL